MRIGRVCAKLFPVAALLEALVRVMQESGDARGVALVQIDARAHVALREGEALLLQHGHAGARLKGRQRAGNARGARANDDHVVFGRLGDIGDRRNLDDGLLKLLEAQRLGQRGALLPLFLLGNGNRQAHGSGSAQRAGRHALQEASSVHFHGVFSFQIQ